MTSDVLKNICNTTREHVRRAKLVKNLAVMEIEASRVPRPRGFIEALQKKIDAGQTALITEIKKASPSAGVIRENYKPSELAKDYEKAGAACLSILTDVAYFRGSNEDMIAASHATRLPVLRKDFILDVWQVAESRAMGADCILLIMAALDDHKAAELHAAAMRLGMDVLIESHNQMELDRALKLPSGLIGINNRDLKTLVTNLAITEDLAKFVPKDRILVSESGINTPEDIKRLKAAGARAFLVGESLLKQGDVQQAVQQLL